MLDVEDSGIPQKLIAMQMTKIGGNILEAIESELLGAFERAL